MKYKFTKKRLCIVFDFYSNPNQTIKQLAARYQTNLTEVSKTLTAFFRQRKSLQKMPAETIKLSDNLKSIKSWKNNSPAR